MYDGNGNAVAISGNLDPGGLVFLNTTSQMEITSILPSGESGYLQLVYSGKLNIILRRNPGPRQHTSAQRVLQRWAYWRIRAPKRLTTRAYP